MSVKNMPVTARRLHVACAAVGCTMLSEGPLPGTLWGLREDGEMWLLWKREDGISRDRGSVTVLGKSMGANVQGLTARYDAARTQDADALLGVTA